MQQESGALAGMRVLECSEGAAGAYCGKLLSDLGAEVISLRRADAANRQSPARLAYLTTGKTLVDLDWDSPEGARRLRELAAEADVLIDDLGPRRSQALLAETPGGLVRCAISPFGATGPYADFKAHHLNVFHCGGEGRILPNGEGFQMFPERPPVQIGSDAADFDAGANAAVAIVAAYRGLLRSGQGLRVDISAQESQLTLNRTRLSRFNQDGSEMRREAHPRAVGGVFRCLDGWVIFLGPHDDYWTRLGQQPGCEMFAGPQFATFAERARNSAELRRITTQWCAARTKQQIIATLAAAGFPVGAFATPEDIVASEQFAYREFFQTIEHPELGRVTLPGVSYKLSATPVRLRAPTRRDEPAFAPRTPATTIDPAATVAPLAGVRVLDFTWAAAGPYATLLLSLLGAEVIKVESLRRPDLARRGFMTDYGGINNSPNFNELNLNKRSFQVDLTQPAGLDLVRKLLPLCDVVVDNFRPGVMPRFGLDAATLLAEHPRLIVASSSGNGSTGPASLTAGLAGIFAAAGGLCEQTGYADGPPTEIGESIDYRSGNAFTLAILAALVHRDRTGQGQAIDLSSTEAVVTVAPDSLLAYLTGAPAAGRRGNSHPIHAPHELYAADGEDEWISIAVTAEEEWGGLCELIGRPEWRRDYASADQRRRAGEEIDAAIAAWAGARSAQEAFELLQGKGIPSAPSLSNRQLAEEPHLLARGVFAEVDHPVIGRQRVMRAPWVFSDAGVCKIHRHGPTLGQDTDFVLEELLQLDAEARAELQPVLR